MRNIFKELTFKLTQLNKHQKVLFISFIDSIILFASWSLFYILPVVLYTKSELGFFDYYQAQNTIIFITAALIYTASLYFLKGSREIMSSFTLENIFPILTSTIIFMLSLFLLNYRYLANGTEISAAFFQSFATGSVAFFIIISSRLIFRFLTGIRPIKASKKIFIYGVGEAAKELYSSLSFDSNVNILGFVTHNKNFIGREIFTKDIISLETARDIWQGNNNIQLYLASRSLSEKNTKKILDFCFEDSIKVKKISTYSDMLKENQINLQDLNISDLIPRKNLDYLEEDLSKLNKKNILITGAGGSIGSEISRIIARTTDANLILADISEASLFVISEEVKEIDKDISLVPLILDIRDSKKVSMIIEKYEIDIIYHAAAYKHVPILESADNFKQALENNFFGTSKLVDAAINFKVEKFIFVSTDKAVRPTNIMGSSKRLAELYIQSRNKEQNHTILSAVRFGNVMDSSGSVIPTFRRQIKSGGPVTVTHPEIIRYFMTIGEAAYLVIMASLMSKRDGIFMLKMGDPVKILDLATRMIRLSGNKVKSEKNDNGIEIAFTGLRPGEKLYEELLVSDSDTETPHPKIFLDTNSKGISSEELLQIREEIKSYIETDSLDSLKELLIKYADYQEKNDKLGYK